ncbi:MAG: TauD/TfdA family dioxygenase [Alphaproteobacteria bacterium]|nr:TauD/TfdA family dioxygenase [Alphaproteobacteria bacterium]
MSISIFPIVSNFAAEVGDIDLHQPLPLDDLQTVRDAFATSAVLIFPAQNLSPEQHLAFAANFGPIERTVAAMLERQKLRVREELADIANLDADGNVWKKNSRMRQIQMMGNRLWHTDSSFKAPSGYASLLYARSIPPIGGNTEFADLRAAYDALPVLTKARLKGMVAEHSLLYSRKRIGFTTFTDEEMTAFAPVRRPLVRTIPESGRESLYIASHIGRIGGMTDEETETLIEELITHATQRQFVYAHRWRVGDLVMWDNRCTMHRGREFDDTRWPRDMQRATTSDRLNAFGVRETGQDATADY